MISRCISCFVLLSQLVSALGVAASQARSPAIGADLERGNVEDRLKALVDLFGIPPAQREPAVWQAARREATRMLAYYRRAEPVKDDDEKELNAAYAAGLVRMLGQSRDPNVIPLLIEYSGMTIYATEALTRFGDLAVPAMLDTATGSHNDT